MIEPYGDVVPNTLGDDLQPPALPIEDVGHGNQSLESVALCSAVGGHVGLP
jgi:hypothetical protein